MKQCDSVISMIAMVQKPSRDLVLSIQFLQFWFKFKSKKSKTSKSKAFAEHDMKLTNILVQTWTHKFQWLHMQTQGQCMHENNTKKSL